MQNSTKDNKKKVSINNLFKNVINKRFDKNSASIKQQIKQPSVRVSRIEKTKKAGHIMGLKWKLAGHAVRFKDDRWTLISADSNNDQATTNPALRMSNGFSAKTDLQKLFQINDQF